MFKNYYSIAKLEKHILTTNEAFLGQLNALKGSLDHLGDVINNNMEKLKSDILEDVHKIIQILFL